MLERDTLLSENNGASALSVQEHWPGSALRKTQLWIVLPDSKACYLMNLEKVRTARVQGIQVSEPY